MNKRARYMQRLKTGSVFGKLVVIEDCGSTEVVCLCECSNPVIAQRAQLKSGTRKACQWCTGHAPDAVEDVSLRRPRNKD